MPNSLSFEVEGLSADFTVVSLSGEEGISRPFRFDLELSAPSAALAFRKVINQPARLIIADGRRKRLIHGIVGRFEQATSGRGSGIYRVALLPELWRLSLRRNCRVFQDLSVHEIVETVLEGAGLAGAGFEFDLSGDYPPIAFAAQYRESDLAFINRITEEHGIWYAFKHGRTGCVITFGDSNDAFAAPTEVALAADAISRFDYAESVTSGKVTLRDFDFERPAAALEATHAGTRFADLETYDFPGGFATNATGAKRAEKRWQGLDARRRGGHAESNVSAVSAGFRFTLTGHPRAALNRDYLVTAVRHRGSATSYDNEFESVVADTPFRPPRSTPAAAVGGSQTATVVGPAGSEIHVDEHGRVKVEFHWDREDRGDDTSSAWIRVCQPWAGAGRGFYFLPRVGDEVLVDFEHGDPRFPIIVGSLYNGDSPPPYPLPGDKTRSGVRTASSPGGGGYNELRFEDSAGGEEIYLRAQKDLNIVVGGTFSTDVNGDQSGAVTGSSAMSTGGDRTETVGRNAAQNIAGAYVLRTKNATIEASGTVTIRTGAAALILEKNGNIAIEGRKISIKGSGEVSIKGRRVVTERGGS